MQEQRDQDPQILPPPPEVPSEPHRIGYARVSTADQNPQMQIDALLRDGVKFEEIYQETVSGTAKKRPQFGKMMRDVRPNDVVTVWKLDRLGRTTRQVLDTIDFIHKRGAKLRILTQMVDTSTPLGNFMLTVIAAFAELERDLTRERTLEGLRAAKSRGRIGGRDLTYTDEQIRAAVALYEAGSSWKDAAATVMGRRGKTITVTRLRARAAALREKENVG
jgi:DNA invertase Pin-like site-specific DNA recombinase